MQAGVPSRSWGNSSLVTPTSTLYASPEKMSSDLFCAFHPKRVMVPSFPLVLNRPRMPSACFLNVFAARFARSDSSEMDSTRPRPKTGVGMRNDRLSRREKCSCLMLQQEVRRIFQQSRRGCERRRRGYHLAFGGSEPLFAGPSGRINGGMRLAAPNFNPTAT